MDYLTSGLLSVALVSMCITVHYEAIRGLEKLTQKFRLHRWMVLITMYGLLLAHVTEIWIFGLGYMFAERWMNIGTVTNVSAEYS